MAVKVKMDQNEELELQKSTTRLEQLAGKTSPFTVPTGYFEELPARIEGAVFAEKLRSAAPGAGFALPDGYFEQLPDRIAERTAAVRQPATIRRMIPWIVSAAACLALVAGLTLVLSDHQASIDDQLARLPEQEIVQYLEVNSAAGELAGIRESAGEASDPELPETSDKAVEAYLKNTL